MPEWRKPGTDAWTRFAIWGSVRDDVRQGRADGWTWVRKKIGEEEQRAFRHPKTRDLFSDQDLTDMLLGVLQRRASTEADAAAVLADVDALLRAGARADAQDEEGRTPLHWAAVRQSNPEVVRMLESAGAPPGAKDGNGRTALAYAEERRESGMVAALKVLMPAEAAVPKRRVEPITAEIVTREPKERSVAPVEAEPAAQATARQSLDRTTPPLATSPSVPRPAVRRKSTSPGSTASRPRAPVAPTSEGSVSVLPDVEPEGKHARELSPKPQRRPRRRGGLAVVVGMVGVFSLLAWLAGHDERDEAESRIELGSRTTGSLGLGGRATGSLGPGEPMRAGRLLGRHAGIAPSK